MCLKLNATGSGRRRRALVSSPERKFESRKITSALIAQLFVAGDTVFFYDECTFSMNDFKGKRWSHSSNQQPLHLRFPGLRIKLNILIAQNKLLAFQPSLDHHTSEDVFNFITVSMANERMKARDNKIKYVVLDNNPKNRSRKLLESAKQNGFGLIFFITLGTPEQNMAENYFLFLKHQYAKLNNLADINTSDNCEFSAIKLILSAMSCVNQTKFPAIRRTFANELCKTLVLNSH